MTMRLYVGEQRTLQFAISDSRHEDFMISQAHFKVTLGDDVIDSGLMDIEGEILSFTFAPKRKGVYRIVIQYTIGLDVMKDRYDIEVFDDNL